MASQTKKRKILRKLKEYNTIWHPDSTLVFKSQKERLVIGRLVDKKLIPLDDEALELCEEWNYKADESLLKQNSENESESDSEKTQSEEEKSNNSEEDNSEEDNPEESEKEEEPVQAIATDTQSDKETETVEVDLPTPSMTTTTNLSSNLPLVESFESLKNNLVQTLTSQLSEIESLKTQNSTLQTERDELNEKYTAIMKKFEAMKSLFS